MAADAAETTAQVVSLAPVPEWIRSADGGVRLIVRVQPGARKPALLISPSGCKIRVDAPPVEGAANNRLCLLIAGWLDVRKGTVGVLRGEHGRDKQVMIQGLDATTVWNLLRAAAV